MKLEGVFSVLPRSRSEEHTSELQSHSDLVCRLLLEKKKRQRKTEEGVLAQGYKIVLAAFPLLTIGLALMIGCIVQSAEIILPVFFFNDTATTEIYTLSLHDALPI